MPYEVTGTWTTRYEHEFDTLAEAIEALEQLVQENRDAAFSLVGEGMQVHVYPNVVKETA